MSKIVVVYGPSAEVAIVCTVNEGGKKEYWRVCVEDDGVLREPAPQMFNLMSDPYVSVEETDEAHPFPLVREQLLLRVAQINTFDILLNVINGDLPLHRRIEWALEANKHGDKVESIEYSRVLFMRIPLPEEAQMHPQVLAKLSAPLRTLLLEVEQKWRPKAT